MKTSGAESPPFDWKTLPEGLRSRGRPLSVHRPWGEALADLNRRFFARFLGESWGNAGTGANVERITMFVLGALMCVAGLVALGFFQFRPPKTEDPRLLLIVAGVAFVLGALMIGLGLFHRRSDREAGADANRPTSNTTPPDLYLVYADGLATVTRNAFEFLAWSDVKEVSSVWRGMDRCLAVTGVDDRQIVVSNGFTNAGELNQAIYQRVNALLLPKALKQIEAGKSAKFGPFAISRSGLKYKDRKASWDDITSMKIQSHGGDRRLTIYAKGTLLRWCWYDLSKVPNEQTFLDALARTAPKRLLTTTTNPRW